MHGRDEKCIKLGRSSSAGSIVIVVYRPVSWQRPRNKEITFAARERLGKHVRAATDTYATIEELLETVFTTLTLRRED
jgi:hypothetical protein